MKKKNRGVKKKTPEEKEKSRKWQREYYLRNKEQRNRYQRIYNAIHKTTTMRRKGKQKVAVEYVPKTDYNAHDFQRILSPRRTEEMMERIIRGDVILVGFQR